MASLVRILRFTRSLTPLYVTIVVASVLTDPGIGYTMLQAVNNNDYSLMQGLFLIITVSVLAANLAVDLLYGVIDPRTRARG